MSSATYSAVEWTHSGIEGSDTVPTLQLLAKLARAPDASLDIALDDDDAG
ncbi:hypothetical protein [Streptomyces sp. SID3343]|nr:hypothetical protein [Streptomyces sp. SID3343]